MKIMTDVEEVAYKKWKKVNKRKSILWLGLTLAIILISVPFQSPLIWIPISIGLSSYFAFLFWQYRGTKKTMRELLKEQGEDEREQA